MSLKQKILPRILFSLIALVAIFMQTQTAYASDGDWTVQSDYTVNGSGVLKVQHIISVENNNDEPTVDQIDVSVFGTDVRGVTATRQDSEPLKSNYVEDQGIVNIALPDSRGIGRQWSLVLSYEADVLTGLGQTKLVQIEPLSISQSNIVSHEVGVALDLGLGFAVLDGPEPDSSKVGVGSQLLEYTNTSGVFEQGLTYFFGEQSSVVANLTAKLENTSFWWQTKRLVLPPDTNQQRVVIESITPKPSKLSLDTDGNVIAEYSLSPKREITVEAQVTIGLRNLTYNLDTTAGLDSIDPILIERYTGGTDAWRPADPAIDVSRDLPVVDQIEGVSRAVAALVNPDDEAERFNAFERGGSLSTSDMLVGELRDRGIPARVVVGRVMSDGAELFESPMNHAWVEAYVPGSGWITIDPDHMSKSDNFGSADVLHIGFGLWGISDDFPPIDLSQWDFRYIDDVLPEEQVIRQPGLVVKKSVIFPGISVQNITVAMASGQIVDGVAVATEDSQEFDFGSLAPLQEASIKSLVFGGAALSTETFGVGILESESFTQLGESVDSALSFRPFITIIILVTIATLIFIIIRKLRSRNTYTRSSEAFIMHEEESGSDIEQEDLAPGVEEDLEDASQAKDSAEEASMQTPRSAHSQIGVSEKQRISRPVHKSAAHAKIAHSAIKALHADQPRPPVAPARNRISTMQKKRSRASVHVARVDGTMASVKQRRPQQRVRVVQG